MNSPVTTTSTRESLDVLRKELGIQRTNLREDVQVEIQRTGLIAGPTATCNLLSLSPLGVRVVSSEPGLVDGTWVGAAVEVKLHYATGRDLMHRGVVVDVSSRSPDVHEMAIRVTAHPTERPPDVERRKYSRLLCSDDFRPTGVASNPAKFNDFILFQILDVSRSGMRLLTSLRNSFIVRGMKLDVIVSFPMVSQISVRITVQNVSFTSIDEKEYLSIGTHLDELTASQRSVVGQYITQFGDAESLSEFRESGFDPRGITGAIEYSVVRTEEDYREVLNLRHLAYLADGKIGESAEVSDVSDIHDASSRILMCKFRGRTIATARLMFPELGDITEHEAFFAWPKEFPRRDEVVEITRACTHPDFRQAGLFFALVRYVVVTAVQAGRHWAVTSSTEDLVPVYRFVGLHEVGITYDHPDLNGHKHVVLLARMTDALTGRSVGPTAWNKVWRDALPYTSTTAFGQDTVSRIRMALYRSVGPLVGPISSALMMLSLMRSPRDRVPAKNT